jgi:hypothetical protein
MTQIVSDDTVSVVNFSYGFCEAPYRSLAVSMDALAKQGNALGMAFETPEFGGGYCERGAPPTPVAPGTSPHFLAIGATRLEMNDGTYLTEGASAMTNGGVSALFALPKYQQHIPNVQPGGRNTPDVAIPADINRSGPASYYAGKWQHPKIFVNNAPVAALLAEIEEIAGTRLGNVTDSLYRGFFRYGYSTRSATLFHDIQRGEDAAGVSAGPGYDAVTGIGSADGYGIATTIRF